MNFNQKITLFKMLVKTALNVEGKTVPDLSTLVDTILSEIASTY